MRSWCRIRSLSCVLLASCAGVAPDPDRVSTADLPRVELDGAQRTALDAHVQDAVEAVVQRRFDEASRAARAAIALDPRSARARAVLAMVELGEAAKQDPVEWRGLRRGEAELARARELAPADAFVGWMQAVFLAEAGHLSAAADAAEDALARCGDAPAAEKAALLGVAGTYRYELGEERARHEAFEQTTAAEITPIRSVDRIEIGPGHRGPITARLQEAFFGLFSGQTPDTHGWLEPVDDAASRPTPVAV